MAKPKDKASLIQDITNRFSVTAREARDIVTSVSSAAQALRKAPQEGMPVAKTIKNVGTQVKETATAAATGKKGTTAMTVKPNPTSAAKRKSTGSGYVTYDTTKPKKRK